MIVNISFLMDSNDPEAVQICTKWAELVVANVNTILKPGTGYDYKLTAYSVRAVAETLEEACGL